MAHGKSLQQLGRSTKGNITLASDYNPIKKSLSRRDKHRAGIQNKSPHKRKN